MPENAAAEGGYGLSASEAFGGQVGTGNVSASAVGGAQGSFGGGEFGGSNPAAQAAAASNAVSVAQGLFSNAGIQSGLLGLAANLSASHAPTAPGMSPGFNPEEAFGLGTPGLNASTGGFLGTTAAPDTAPTADPSGYAMADVTGVNSMSPADVAAIGTQVDVDAAMNRGGLQSGNFGPGLLGGTVSSADLASGNMSTTGIPGGTGSVSTNAAGNISPAQASGIVSAIGPVSGGTGTNDAANAAAAAQMEAAMATTPAISIAPATSVAPATNVSPATVAQDISRSTVAPATTTPAQTTYSEKGLLGRIAQDLAMGLSINPFASREDQAAGLRGRGYSQAEIDGYFGRTDANIAATNAAVENAVGARDFINDMQLNQFGETLAPTQRQQFEQMDRNGKLNMYYRAMGY